MGYGVINADLMTTSDGVSAAGLYGMKNRIINGDMRIDQRNAGASVTPATSTYTLDRWNSVNSITSKYTVQQVSDAPTGFINSLKVTSSAATSLGSTDYYYIQQNIEGLNVSDFAFGTASAVTSTLSFWVKSSLTGTFGGVLSNSASNRSYPFTYTISSANTWEQKSVTIAGDTSGTWLTTNGVGLRVDFGLGVGTTYSGTAGSWAGTTYVSATGATSVVGTNGATFYITGVQLEKGTTATSFDYRPYGTELLLCQRYYETSICTTSAPVSAGSGYFSTIPFKASKRASPTITVISNITGTLDSIGTVTSEYASGTHTTSGNVAKSTVSISSEL